MEERCTRQKAAVQNTAGAAEGLPSPESAFVPTVVWVSVPSPQERSSS